MPELQHASKEIAVLLNARQAQSMQLRHCWTHVGAARGSIVTEHRTRNLHLPVLPLLLPKPARRLSRLGFDAARTDCCCGAAAEPGAMLENAALLPADAVLPDAAAQLQFAGTPAADALPPAAETPPPTLCAAAERAAAL